jgi:dTDP-4-amino-4,6-dideoxygalactose transaminase
LGAYSFHETKNVISGEGGALLINDANMIERAEIIREKGTDRSRFLRGQVDKYTWQELGSSFLPGELIAAFLWAQLEEADRITEARMVAWHHYHERLAPLEADGCIRRPIVPEGCEHNAHMYYVLLPPELDRQIILDEFGKRDIFPIFHYVPLHSSPAGLRYGRPDGPLPVTNSHSERLVRLPLWVGVTASQQDEVVQTLIDALRKAGAPHHR